MLLLRFTSSASFRRRRRVVSIRRPETTAKPPRFEDEFGTVRIATFTAELGNWIGHPIEKLKAVHSKQKIQ
jgi:hypothetical protein